MNLINLKCAKCDAFLGSIANQWTQIGKSYLTSTARPEALRKFGVKTSGAARFGGVGSVIEGCELQDVKCQSCDANLGLKCLDTPEDHMLSPDQVIFRTSSIYTRQATDQRRRAEPAIQEFVELKKAATPKEPSEEPVLSPSSSPSPAGYSNFFPFNEATPDDAFDVLQLQAELEAQREDIQKIGTKGMKIVSKFEDSMAKVESKVQDVNETVGVLCKEGQQRSEEVASLREELEVIRRKCPHGALVSRLKQQCQSTEEAVAQLRDIIAKAQGDAEHLRVDLSLREEELEQMRTRNTELEGDLVETKKLAQESFASAKAHAKRSGTLQKEIADAKSVAQEGVSTAREYSSEIINLRKELKHLRADIAKERSERQKSERDREKMERQRPGPAPGPAATATAGFSSRELDILTSRISKIGSQASQVESLQMEFELFKSRVQRLEDGRLAATESDSTSSSKAVERPQGAIDAYDVDLLEDESPSVYVSGLAKQKRKRPSAADYEEHEKELDLPAKRSDITSDYYSATTTGSSSIGDGQDSSPWNTSSRSPGGLRFTKNGEVDRRSLRYKKGDKKVGNGRWTAKG